MKFVMSVAVLMMGTISFAGESGVLYQGKSYVLFRDGKKVGDIPEGLRKPASMAQSSYLIIRYEKDQENGVICYYNNEAPDKSTSVSCVRAK